VDGLRIGGEKEKQMADKGEKRREKMEGQSAGQTSRIMEDTRRDKLNQA